LIIYSFNTSAAGINDVQAGSLNVAQVALDGVRQGVRVIQSTGGKFAGTPYASLYSVSLILNPKVAPFNNPLYRKAVQAAINPRVVDAGEGGACAVDQQPVAPGSSTYDPNFVNTNPYNPAKAKQYLAQAGVPKGFTFDMPTPNFSNFTTSGQIYQAELAKVGIKANIVPIDPASFVSTLYGGKWPAFVYGGAPGVPDPVSGLFPNLLVGGPAITIGSSLESAATSFYKTLSNPKYPEAKRTTEFHKLYRWMNDTGMYLTMCAQQALYIHTNNVLNVQPHFPSAIEDPQFYAMTK
jgi:ABC-type transport system substrate-binding protein